MQDDSPEKPKKLRLAKDAREEAVGQTRQEDPAEPTEATPQAADPGKDRGPEAPAEKSAGATPQEEAAPNSSHLQLRQKQAENPADESEPRAHASPGGESGPAAGAPTARDLLPADDSRNNLPESERPTHSILPSLVVVGILFLILGAAGFGLWKILFSSEASTRDAAVEATQIESGNEPVGESAPSHPIERARQTIETVPEMDPALLEGQNAPTVESDTSAAPEAKAKEAPADTAPANTLTAETIADTTTDTTAATAQTSASREPASAAIEATKAAASEFLASLHIGGMREGPRPMILIEGRTHNVGDTVQTQTGLKFDGIRDGKLAFIDRNDIVYLKSF